VGILPSLKVGPHDLQLDRDKKIRSAAASLRYGLRQTPFSIFIPSSIAGSLWCGR